MIMIVDDVDDDYDYVTWSQNETRLRKASG